MSNVEKLKVREQAIDLATDIYACTKNWKDFGLASQMQRAAVSISSNIAEGSDRETTKEYIRFLYIARGSSSELKSQLFIAYKIEYITKEDLETLLNTIENIHKMLNGLINHLKIKIKPRN